MWFKAVVLSGPYGTEDISGVRGVVEDSLSESIGEMKKGRSKIAIEDLKETLDRVLDELSAAAKSTMSSGKSKQSLKAIQR